jgi:hypothetical protein
MVGRIITLALLLAAGYWYWSGPYQARTRPDYRQSLEHNAETMRLCVHSRNYRAGATGQGTADPEAACAMEHNLYRHEGQWHSYDRVRPDSGAGG